MSAILALGREGVGLGPFDIVLGRVKHTKDELTKLCKQPASTTAVRKAVYSGYYAVDH